MVWVHLERHPFIANASFVEEIAGRLYIAMEYVAPNEQGLNSLEGYLREDPPDLVQALRWAVQFCRGIEYAYSRGIRCHRDIKPSNILIGHDRTVRVSDFGLAGALDVTREAPTMRDATVGFQQTMAGIGFGTPTHMPPEQFTNAAACDERSDIYSFGIVLYQMVAGGALPFLARPPKDGSEDESVRFRREMYALHREVPAPEVDSPLWPVIRHCLEKHPTGRYQKFAELRNDLTKLFIDQFPVARPGSIAHVIPKEIAAEILEQYEPVLERWEWNNKGASLATLGRFEEALSCFDKALEIDPQSASTWANRGNTLNSLGRYEDAAHSIDKAIELGANDPMLWYIKAICEDGLGRTQEAAQSFERFLAFAPNSAVTHVEYATKRSREIRAN